MESISFSQIHILYEVVVDIYSTYACWLRKLVKVHLYILSQLIYMGNEVLRGHSHACEIETSDYIKKKSN